MKQKTILIIIGILVVVGAIYLVKKNDTKVPSDSNGTIVSGTIGDLLSQGGNWECEWESTKGGIIANGSIRVSDNRFKTDVESTQGDTTLVAHAVSDGEFVFSWTNLAPFGAKMSLVEVEDAEIDVDENPQGQMFVEDFDFDCKPWTVDESVFAVPSGINFINVETGN